MACSAFFQPYIDWMQQALGNGLSVYGVANRSDIPTSCYYMEGRFYSYDGTRFTGDGWQYFNDRVKLLPFPPGTVGIDPGISQPFDANAYDNLGLTLNPNDSLVFTLQSWGNVQMTYSIECSNSLLIGTCGAIKLLMAFKKDNFLASL